MIRALRLLLAASLVLAAGSVTAAHYTAPAPVQAVQEDDPGWDCHTMGNHVCGQR